MRAQNLAKWKFLEMKCIRIYIISDGGTLTVLVQRPWKPVQEAGQYGERLYLIHNSIDVNTLFWLVWLAAPLGNFPDDCERVHGLESQYADTSRYSIWGSGCFSGRDRGSTHDRNRRPAFTGCTDHVSCMFYFTNLNHFCCPSTKQDSKNSSIGGFFFGNRTCLSYYIFRLTSCWIR